ncbi:MAG: transglycosylase domain-containing protein [Raoultibacter sp.]
MASRASKNRTGKKTKQPFVGFLIFLAVVVGLVAAGGITAYALGSSWLEDLPNYEDSAAFNTAQKTTVKAGDNTTVLGEFYAENREPVTADKISPYVLKGTVATEDERFYDHGGIDVVGIGRAVLANLTGSSEGASTITQQFVRNTVLADEMTDITFKRKVREMYISVKIEEKYTKDEILLMYLNTINYGSATYGIEAASQKYFSKSALDLTLVEAATLVGIPQSPTALNPIDHPQACFERRNTVLQRMLSNEVITRAEYDDAVAQEIVLNIKPDDKGDGLYRYPYFTSYVRQLLIDEFGQAEVLKGGMTVYTTLDIPTQDAAERAAANKEANIDDDLEVALTAVDPDTGFIKAMVGGRDYYTDEYNLATQAHRSPGSSFKTYTLVAALEAGISPQTSVDCSSPVTLGTWRVENYGNAQYGTRSIASAFAVSSNTGFARLVTHLTPEKVVEVAKRMGIESPLDPVPAITLGAEEVTVREMAGAYAPIANGGTARGAIAIKKVVNRNGIDITPASTKAAAAGTKAITPEIACAARKVMEGVVTNGTGTAARLANGQPVAGKTGTSEDWNDSYFCGVTPQLSVAVWLGARVQRQMPEGVTATSVFSDFMDQVLDGQPIEQFPTAQDPVYKSVYDASLHINGGGSSGSSGNYSSGDDGGSNSSSPSSTPGTGGTTSGGTTSGGTTPGGTTPGGTPPSGGGDTPPSGGGGTPPSGGGDTPGGGGAGGDTPPPSGGGTGGDTPPPSGGGGTGGDTAPGGGGTVAPASFAGFSRYGVARFQGYLS